MRLTDKGRKILRDRDDLPSRVTNSFDASKVASSVAMPRNQFDQFHQRYRIHEVNADKALGPVGGCGQPRDRDRRGVGSDDGLRLQDRTDIVKNLRLISSFSTAVSITISQSASPSMVSADTNPVQRLLAGILGDDLLENLAPTDCR